MTIQTGNLENDVQGTIGNSISGIAVTETLFVSPDGNGTNGSNWTNAYTTIQAALNAASVDGDDCTLIMVSPNATTYDINITGDPTWTGNYHIKGSHRNWAKITNSHASATSIMKFTGKVSIEDVTIDIGYTDLNGVIISGSGTKGCRLRHTYFEAEHATGAHTCLEISGGTEYAKLEDVMFHGEINYTTGLIINNCKFSDIHDVQFHDCLVGMQQANAASDGNEYHRLLFHTCTLGIDLDAGNSAIFDHLNFYDCTRNVDDEVGDATWRAIHGQFPIYIYPDDFTGITVASAAGAGTWGSLTEIVAAAAIDNPFRIVAVHFAPSVNQWSRVRFTADAGTTYYDDLMFDVKRREGQAAPSGTEFIFNADTKIEAMAKVDGGGPDNINVWIEIQEI